MQAEHLNDKVILITGGTGSFGQEFVDTVLASATPEKLIVFSRDELKQHQMQQRCNAPCMRYFIGDVRDKERLYRAMHGVDIVVHAAALKQVPTCEYNPFEAIKTNIMGTQNVIDAAIDSGVQVAIALSTDKAVNPVNLYGATKLCAEKIFVQSNNYSGQGGTRFAVCRYGNVVGSRGSVVPVFVEQRKNGSVTITDQRMTRFWLTVGQGVEFVIMCTDVMQGGEVFVPKIPSMRVVDLAEAIAPGCEIERIGIRPGEKIHEALISQDEARQAVEMDDMYVVQPVAHGWRAEQRPDGRALPEGFSYTSDANTKWLSVEQLRELVT